MTTKIKLIILAVILVGTPMAAYIIKPLYFIDDDFTLVIIPFAMVFFGALFAMYFMRLKTGNLTNIRLLLKWGIYSYIAFFILLIADDLYYMFPLLLLDLRVMEMGGVGNASGFPLKDYHRYLFIGNYPSLILIALMYLSLRINKSIEKDVTTPSQST